MSADQSSPFHLSKGNSIFRLGEKENRCDRTGQHHRSLRRTKANPSSIRAPLPQPIQSDRQDDHDANDDFLHVCRPAHLVGAVS